MKLLSELRRRFQYWYFRKIAYGKGDDIKKRKILATLLVIGVILGLLFSAPPEGYEVEGAGYGYGYSYSYSD